MSRSSQGVSDLPDLRSAEGRAVACDQLMERGWPIRELPQEPAALVHALLSGCFMALHRGLGPALRAAHGHLGHRLACDYAELALPVWEADRPGDRRPGEAVRAKRAWLDGALASRAVHDAARAAREAAWETASEGVPDAVALACAHAADVVEFAGAHCVAMLAAMALDRRGEDGHARMAAATIRRLLAVAPDGRGDGAG